MGKGSENRALRGRGEGRFVAYLTPTGKEIEHGGTGSAYSNYGCRCHPCTDANSERIRIAKEERDANSIPAGVKHGRKSTYANWKCRCDDCKQAARERD